MTRHIKLCISLLLALLLTFTVALGVLADPETDPDDTSTDSESSSDSSDDSSNSSDNSTAEPSDKRTVTVQVEHALVYFNDFDTPAKQISVEPGSSLTLRVVPEDGFQVQSVTMNGLPLPGSAGVYTLGSVMSDCILVVEVSPIGTSTEDPSDPTGPSDPTDPGDMTFWDVTVTVHGAGSVTVSGTVVTSDGSAAVTQVVQVQDTVQSGEKAQFLLKPAAGYRVGRIVIDGNGNYTPQNDFRSQITEPTTVEITFVSEEEMPSSFPVTIRVSEGGYVSANGQEVLGGSTATIDVAASGSINLWLNASAGYELEALIVDGVAENIKSGSFTLQNVGKAVNIQVTFKPKASANPVQASDFDWMPDIEGNIKLDLTANDYIGKSVFDKINTLSEADGEYVVLMTQYVRWYIPCGQRIEGATGDFRLSVATGVNATYYDSIKEALQSDNNPDNDIFNFYQLSEEPFFPEGTKVSFQMMALADAYNGNAVDLMARVNQSGQWVLLPVGTGSIRTDGWTSLLDFRNSCYQVVVVQPSSGQSDVTSSTPAQSSSFSIGEEEEPGGKSYAGLIVALVIAFVAVGGAAALFIVKWRQEKF